MHQICIFNNPSLLRALDHHERRLWRWLGLVFVPSFAVLGYLGWQIYLEAPPIPKAVVSADGETLFTGDDIKHGQQAWLSAGGQQLGTVWGHGSYVAPDWSADWLHREALALRDLYDEKLGVITVSTERARAIKDVARHFEGLFVQDASLAKLREQYAMVGAVLLAWYALRLLRGAAVPAQVPGPVRPLAAISQ